MEPKINTNRAKITDEDIEKGKDFDKLLAQFKEESIQKAKKDKRLPRLRKLVYTGLIAGVVVVCTVTFNQFSHSSNDKTAAHQTDKSQVVIAETGEKKFIQPLSKKVTLPYSTYKVSAHKGGTITHPSSSTIKIPKGAFVKKNGAEVKGDVEIQYREMHDAVDFMVSGIPMSYDSAGKNYDFESAGMIDIKGFQEGEPVFIKPGKELEVNMASRKSGTRFNLYELDTVAQKWIYKGKDKVIEKANHTHIPVVTAEERKNPKIQKIEKGILAIETKKDSVVVVTDKKIALLPLVVSPQKPQPANKDRKKFTLDVDFNDFPELSAYKGCVFEIGEENTNYTSEFNKVEWHEAHITKGTDPGKNYTLNLRWNSRNEKLIVYPVLDGNNLKAALTQYEGRFKEYEKLLSKRNAEEEKLKKELDAKIAAFNLEQERLVKEMQAERKRIQNEAIQNLTVSTAETMDSKVSRMFYINNFGIHNTDCPQSKPQGITVDAEFVVGKSVLRPAYVYLIPYGQNMIYNYSFHQFGSFSFNPQENYYIVASVNEKLYLCGKDAFKKAAPNQDKTTFEFEEINLQSGNIEDLRKKLGV